jgi:hypothetical protein
VRIVSLSRSHSCECLTVSASLKISKCIAEVFAQRENDIRCLESYLFKKLHNFVLFYMYVNKYLIYYSCCVPAAYRNAIYERKFLSAQAYCHNSV